MSDEGKILLLALGVFTLGGHSLMALFLWTQSKRREANQPLNICGPGGWALLGLLFGGFSLWLFRQAHLGGDKILPSDSRLCFAEPADPKAWVAQHPRCLLHVYDDWGATDSQLAQSLLEFWRPRAESLSIARVDAGERPEWRHEGLPPPFLVLYRDGHELNRFSASIDPLELGKLLATLDPQNSESL
ncbi:MAG: hypothetical protein RL095_3195 [Verrucomicrobiota bacterium]|jgi:hypothetical protein